VYFMKYFIFSSKPEETNTSDTPVISRMTRGYPPWVAIEEAMHYAERLGYLVTGRELWGRGPDRHWHRFVISPDRIVVSDRDIFGVRSSQQLGQQMLPVR